MRNTSSTGGCLSVYHDNARCGGGLQVVGGLVGAPIITAYGSKAWTCRMH